MKTFNSNITNLNSSDTSISDAAPLGSDLLFTAPVSVSGPVVNANHFVTKQYFETTLSTLVSSIPGAILKDGSNPMLAPLQVHNVLTMPFEIISKGYVNTTIASTIAAANADTQPISNAITSTNVGIPPGSIVRKPTGITPSGFVKVNGAALNKIEYNNIYSYVGDSYTTMFLNAGSGQPWRQQATINNSSAGVTTPWATETSLAFKVCYAQVAVTNSRAFLLGGWGDGIPSNGVYMANISSGGVLGTWSKTGVPQLPIPLVWSQAIMTSSRLYMIGGHDGNSVYTNTMYYAPINMDGTIGNWVVDLTNILPGNGLTTSNAIVTYNRVYLIGGYGTAGVGPSRAMSAPINSLGVIGGWTVETNVPPIVAYGATTIITNRAVYLLGGTPLTGARFVNNQICKASINIDGTLGPWSLAPGVLPDYSTDAVSVATSTRIFLIAGYNRVGRVRATRYTTINVDGTLGTWASGPDLPQGYFGSSVLITSTKIYLIGGSQGSNTGSNMIYSSTFSGGRNSYIDITNVPAISDTQFALPDLTTYDSNTPGVYSYMKI